MDFVKFVEIWAVSEFDSANEFWKSSTRVYNESATVRNAVRPGTAAVHAAWS